MAYKMVLIATVRGGWRVKNKKITPNSTGTGLAVIYFAKPNSYELAITIEWRSTIYHKYFEIFGLTLTRW